MKDKTLIEMKKIIIVLAVTAISLALHATIPVAVPITDDVTSVVVDKLSFVGTVSLFFIVTYFLIATVFLKYESKLYGSKITRALMFGGLVGGIWWVGMIEATFIFGTHFIEEFLTGIFDFIPIVILCLLLSIILVKEQKEENGKTNLTTRKHLFASIYCKSTLLDVGIFASILVIGRALRYYVDINSYYPEDMLKLLIWTIAFALIIALNFIYFKHAATGNLSSISKSALLFTFVLFGIHYAMFVYFVPLIFQGMFIKLTIVLLYDLLLVLIASFVALKSST